MSIYLDNGATSFPKAPGVGEAMLDYVNNIGANVNRSTYEASSEAEMVLIECRERLCTLFGTEDITHAVFTPGMTAGLNMLLKGFLRPGDHVIVSSLEHNAMMRPIRQLEAQGVEFSRIPADSRGITEATNRELAIRLLDEGMRRMPPAQVRYTSNNTLPFIEAYYAAGAADKGDALMLDYARNLMEYVDYYFQFDGWQYDSITDALDEKLDLLGNLYSMAGYLKRDAVLTELNAYYRSLGVTEEELIQPDSAHLDYEVSDTAAVN